jgi:hypothetical protein
LKIVLPKCQFLICSSLKHFQFTEDCESELQQNKVSTRLETYMKYIWFVLTHGFQTMSYLKVSMYKLWEMHLPLFKPRQAVISNKFHLLPAESLIKCNSLKQIWKSIIIYINIIEAVSKHDTFYSYKSVWKLSLEIYYNFFKTLVYLKENFNLKYEFSNYYIHYKKDLMRKKIIIQNR